VTVAVDVVTGADVPIVVVTGLEVVADVGRIVVVVKVDVVDVVAVDFAQDDKTRDTTMRMVSAIQITPLFIWSSYYFLENFWKIDCNLTF
jgi:hypothetical protein